MKLTAKDSNASEVIQATPSKQPRLDFNLLAPSPVTQGQPNTLVAQYVVDNMHPLSGSCGVPVQAVWKTHSSHLDSKYAKVENKLKKAFKGLQYICPEQKLKWTLQAHY